MRLTRAPLLPLRRALLRDPRLDLVWLFAVAALPAIACDSVSSVETGAIEVTSATTGSLLDPDGYAVSLDAAPGQAIGVNASLTLSEVTPGEHTVELAGLAANCTVTEANPGTVTVVANATAQIGFTVTCGSGSIAITTETSGSALDPDGYTVRLDAGPVQPIGIDASLTLSDIAPGPHTVELAGLAANCTVTESNPGAVTVVANATAEIGFTVTCSAGSIAITTETSGGIPDPDGYTVSLDAGPGRPIGIDASLTLSDIAPGPHTVELAGLAANCTVTESNPGAVTVVANATAQIGFTVTCSAGSIAITTETSGDLPDPDGYAVSVDGGPAQPIGINASITLSDVASGQHSVRLSGLASNCTVNGPNPLTVTVVANATAQVSLPVSCPFTGAIRVTVSTTGPNIPDIFLVSIDHQYPFSGFISPNGSATSGQLSVGSHSVSLYVTTNCGVIGPSTQTVAVQNGVRTQVNFTVVCS